MTCSFQLHSSPQRTSSSGKHSVQWQQPQVALKLWEQTSQPWSNPSEKGENRPEVSHVFVILKCTQTWRKITYLFFPELMKHLFNHFTFNLHFWSEGKRVNSNTFDRLTLYNMNKWFLSLWICSASTEQQKLNLAFSVEYSSKTMYTTIHGLFIS